ncbi:class I SAM-dependent methyltransferase [Aquamicrobium sp.]|uniref:class I SAM-dependent methyltransferase n=1 Tax=Aquamicrobium sp. TaxID=1872579 RepID=UPI002583085E|nr:class I SAM-dependent methyltransferase [Aquamicrobium sp.]MCK9550468.1 class I SAM-dependent methyltransferase [Aquamicrobium sp.]
MIERRDHWENVYLTKDEADVSWFEETPALSLDLLQSVGAKPSSSIVDIGGGASRLVDALLARGFRDLTVLDLSVEALAVARRRLGNHASAVEWVAADVTEWKPERRYDIWHDRAAFHFLTTQALQRAYVDRLERGLQDGGHAIIGTFALDGPEKCSGLPVARHDSASLATLLGEKFALVDARRHDHVTPMGTVQRFQFSTFRRK